MAYTTNWQHTGTLMGMQGISEVSTTQMHPLGTVVQARDAGSNANGAGSFMYVKGVASGTRGDWVGINLDDGTTIRAVANGIYPIIGVFMSTLDAATSFGWAQIQGKAVARAAVGFLDDGNCYVGTAGIVSSTDVAGDFISGAKGASAVDFPETGMAEFEIFNPFTRDGLDN